MDETSSGDSPRGEDPPSEAYPALRAARRVLIGAVLLFTLAYYNIDLIPMVGHTLIPFVALVGLGTVVGALVPRKLAVVVVCLWWITVLASLLRRSAVADLPLGSQIFDGALKFYPSWGVWLAEALRLGVYLWALWLGGKTGRRLFRRGATAEAP